MDFTPEQSENQEKPEVPNNSWLKELGEQSWQAELVISGLVITGLFQMPDIFIKWVEEYIIQSGTIEYYFLDLASTFFLIGIDVMIIFFGIHLLFRGIWIALLGLNSVYPKGVNVESTFGGYNKKYWQKSKDQYPDLTAYTVELDARCSVFFSSATLVMIVISSTSIFILVFYQCIRLLTSYFPVINEYIIHIGIGAYLIFLLVSVVAQYLVKKYPDNKKIEKIMTGYGTVMTSVFSLYIFKKPIGYISAIQMSNSKSNTGKYIFLIASGVMGFVGAKQKQSHDVFDDFEAKKYFIFNNKPYQIRTFNYENLLDKESEIYTPVIQSDVITDDYLKVFIPTIARETEQMDLKDYNFIDRFKMNDAQRRKINENELAVYQKFNRIYLNGVEYPKLEPQFYWHEQASDRGLLVYVPTDSLPKGRNILEIRKDYFSKDSVQKIVKIPFFFKKKSDN
jgi:hypothetical protein